MSAPSSSDRPLPRVCVIGAGSSGIATCKVLHERGIPFDCYEKSDRVGGNWVFQNKNGMSSSYRSLHINTSRDRMQYSDFPMPKSYPDFPHHSQIAAYFERYVDHFGFRESIRFETGVERAERRPDGLWEIRTDRGETHLYDALAVANGHHWDPQWPDPPFPGKFDGVQMHAHHYIDNENMRGRRVLVLGMGNSAMDIAVEASLVAERTYLAARRGAWIIPKYLYGRPLDQYVNNPRLPLGFRKLILWAMLRVQVGRPEHYGLPRPDHAPTEAHPTISDGILSKLTHGDILVKPNIRELKGDRVAFVDGSEEAVDIIVYCTGYKVTFPFFDPGFIAAPDNDLPLYRRVFKPEIPNVFFVGLLQPLGAIMPLAEAQSHWIADYLTGRYAPPSVEEMREDMKRERAAMFRRYVASKRHTMQVDFDDYLFALAKERKRGAARAASRGGRLPIEPKAGQLEAAGSGSR